MMSFEKLVEKDWLAAFCEYGSYGESSPRLMYWVGVSTLAAALQRKVWIDCKRFQWSPNFYILIVGEQGVVRKSTSIDVGMRLLRQFENDKSVYIGPDTSTWQSFITDASCAYREVVLPDGEVFASSSITLPLSEFGTFFDPDDRMMIDVLTDLWDGKTKPFRKNTKTSGNDVVENPWINMIAATTPSWIAKHMPNDLLGSGLMSRFILLREDMPSVDIAYPHRCMPKGYDSMASLLSQRLQELISTVGTVELTEEAYAWGETWYEGERAALRKIGASAPEAGFIVRKQVHLHKLAMVMAASEGTPLAIDVKHLQAAATKLQSLEGDARRVFDVVGQSSITGAARTIVEAVRQAGATGISKRKLYRDRFFRTMRAEDYEAAIRSAVQAELLLEVNDVAQPLLFYRPDF